jgi:hypothetical protein
VNPFLLAQCVYKLLRVRLLLARFGFEACLSKLHLRDVSALSTLERFDAGTEIWRTRALYLRKASRLIPGAFCLARALTLCHWARSNRVPIRLVIGVKRTQQTTDLHAWSILNAQVLDSDAAEISQFKTLFEC